MTRPHGVRGELRLIPYSFEDELPETVERVCVDAPRGQRCLTLTDVRTTNDAYLVRFAEIADRDEAAALAGGQLTVRRQDLPALGEGEYFLFEIIGAAVVDEAGASVGTVRGLSQIGGQDLVAIATARGEQFLNMASEMVLRFDRPTRTLTVRLSPGIWE